MRVYELIKLLELQDKYANVVCPGYENGFDVITDCSVKKLIKQECPAEWDGDYDYKTVLDDVLNKQLAFENVIVLNTKRDV
jgi:hypothetical protein